MKEINIDTQNPEFLQLLNLVENTSQSVFLTGKAGSGKSTFLRYICQTTAKKYVVLAPTGIAAINAEGSTIHSFFKLPFRPMLPDDPDLSTNKGRIYEFFKYTREHKKLIKEVDLIIIDEISMVRADMIDVIDRILRVYSGNQRSPFGGKQLLFVGDIFQLEPVVTSDSKDILRRYYQNPYFFSARVFSEISLVAIELQKVYRQNNPEFVAILDKIRTNTARSGELRIINSRYTENENLTSDKGFVITLATRRDTVDHINLRKLQEIDSKEYVFNGRIKGDFPENSLPTSRVLTLKEGAQIIFIKNDYERRWVNGTIGRISQITTNSVSVELENGNIYTIAPDSWRNIKYTYDEEQNKIVETELGSFEQYPLRLAWAVTIHKSQGLTFTNVIIDLKGGAFAGGQTYVALSRCTSLEGIILKQPISGSDIFISPDIVAFSRHFNDKRLIEKALKEANTVKYYKDTARYFDAGDFEKTLESFFLAIHAKYDIERPEAQRLIRRKLGIINTLREKNKTLQKKLLDQHSRLRELAEEYVLMGNECIVKASDPDAAIRNFDKAITISPTLTDAWVRKGVTLYDMDDFYNAAICLNKAVELSPQSFKAVFNRGKLRSVTQDYDGAISDFLKAVSLKPENPTAHSRLADMLSKTGKEELAAKHREIARLLRERRKKDNL